MFDYQKKVTAWEDSGTEPPEGLRKWRAGEKPPAAWWNWFWDAVQRCFEDIKNWINGHKDANTGVHGVGTGHIETVEGAQSKINTGIAAHESATNPHPVYATDNDLAVHSQANTGVHGVAVGQIIETESGAQSKVNTAMQNHMAVTDAHPLYATKAELTTKQDSNVPFLNKMPALGLGTWPHPDAGYAFAQYATAKKQYKPDWSGIGTANTATKINNKWYAIRGEGYDVDGAAYRDCVIVEFNSDMSQILRISSPLTGIKQVISSCTDGTYLYLGTNTTPAKLIKVNVSDFSVISNNAMNIGDDKASAMIYASNLIFIGLNTSPARLAKFNPNGANAPLQVSTTLALASGNYLSSLTSDGTFVFMGVGQRTAPLNIAKINPNGNNAMVQVGGNFVAATNENAPTVLYFDGTYLYASAYYEDISFPSNNKLYLIKINPSTMAKVGNSLFVNMSWSSCYSLGGWDGTYLYLADNSSLFKISRNGGSDMSKVGNSFQNNYVRVPIVIESDGLGHLNILNRYYTLNSVQLNTNGSNDMTINRNPVFAPMDDQLYSYTLVFDGRNYVMGGNKIVKIDAKTLNKIAEYALNPATDGIIYNNMISDGTYLYAYISGPAAYQYGRIMKFNLVTMQPEAYYIITESSYYRCLGFDGRYLYLAFDTKLAKLDTAGNMSYIGIYSFTGGESGIIDVIYDGKYMYCSFMQGGPAAGKIAKMTANDGNLPTQVGTTFTFADTTNDTGGTYLVFDGVYIYAMFPRGAGSSRVAKLNPNGSGNITQVGSTLVLTTNHGGGFTHPIADGLYLYLPAMGGPGGQFVEKVAVNGSGAMTVLGYETVSNSVINNAHKMVTDGEYIVMGGYYNNTSNDGSLYRIPIYKTLA